MKGWPVAILVVLALASVALPYRFGMFALIAPALVLGGLALSGVVREYDERGNEVGVRDSLFAEHGVKLLAVAGVLCMVGILGGMRACNAAQDRAASRGLSGSGEETTDFIRERSRAPRPPAPSRGRQGDASNVEGQ